MGTYIKTDPETGKPSQRWGKTPRGTDKIDIYAQTYLSDDQCAVAVAVWAKYGVFITESSIHKRIRQKYGEFKIWNITFRNYTITNEADFNKMKKLTTQIIDYYKDNHKYNGVDRICYRDNNESWCVICKPEKSFARTSYNRRVKSAATNMVKAEKTNDSFQLGHIAARDFLENVENKFPDLIERRIFFDSFKKVIENKIEYIDQIEGGAKQAALEYSGEKKDDKY
ncbi:MAG: hypothetical protein D4S01_06320 [Dehalococcoidia bacterium]|nr:MAG: hypothetical protein D4S01_06320 [Dehalococcoidia bacterium]